MTDFFRKLRRARGEGRFGLRYSPSVALSYFKSELQSDSVRKMQIKNEAAYEYLRRKYGNVVLHGKSARSNAEKSGVQIIWVLWWQGEESMPDIIKACHKSKQKHSCGAKVVLLDKNNVKSYTDLPDFVWRMYDEGRLLLQHLADMIRVNLINRNGGIWLDASIYCKTAVPSEIFDLDFFTLKGEKEGFEEHISLNQWTTFAIGGKKGNAVCAFLNDLFIEYCKAGKPFLYYYMFDCAIALGYREIPEITRLIDNVPKALGDRYWLDRNFDRECGEALIREMLSEPSYMYKISWKKPHEGENTLYQHILKEAK